MKTWLKKKSGIEKTEFELIDSILNDETPTNEEINKQFEALLVLTQAAYIYCHHYCESSQTRHVI